MRPSGTGKASLREPASAKWQTARRNVLCLSGTFPSELGEQDSERRRMIKLTRLDGEAFVLNAELIRYVESRPDTFITLVSGDRLVVRESLDEVLDRTVRYQQSKYLIPSAHHQVQRTS